MELARFTSGKKAQARSRSVRGKPTSERDARAHCILARAPADFHADREKTPVRPYVVLYNGDDNIRGGSALDALAVRDVQEAARAVAASLRRLGEVAVVESGDGDPERLARQLRAQDPCLVFNLADAVGGVAEREAHIPALLELLGLPYTGNTSQTLALCLDKPKTKALLRRAGLPTPSGAVLRDPWRDSLTGPTYPVIVKPTAADASHGIEPTNVVEDERAARSKAAEIIARFPPAALVETFIDGREFNVAVVQLEPSGRPELLPLAEIDWRLPEGVPRVCGFTAKWVASSESAKQTPIVCPAAVSATLERRIRDLCVAAFDAVSGRDYLRIDLRVDENEDPSILEINPNPCLSPDAGLARSARVAGWSYDELIERIARQAEARGSVASRSFER